MANTIQVKRGNYADLPSLLSGEPGFCVDTGQLFFGNGAVNVEIVSANNFDAGTVLYATADNTPQPKTRAELLALLSGQASGAFSFNSQKITNVATPTAANDGTNKAYVDSVAQGLKVHDAVDCASSSNITLSGEQTIDGVTTSTSRVLVIGQTDATENGIYVSGAGAWARATDMDEDTEVAGSFVFVSGGTTLGHTGWVCTNEPEATDIGVDNIIFAQFSDAGYISASQGLTKVGNDIRTTGILEDINTMGPSASDGQFMVATGSGAVAWESGATVRASLGLIIGTDVMAQKTIGIANDNLVEMDDADAAVNDYARFTANGLEGRSYAEVLGDLSGQAGADFSMNAKKITNLANPVGDQDAATKKWVSDNFSAGSSTFLGLTDTPGSFTANYITKVNGAGSALEFVSFGTTYLEAAPSDGETNKAPTSNWAHDHAAATTGVHGAGGNNLLNSGSTIDGGTFV